MLPQRKKSIDDSVKEASHVVALRGNLNKHVVVFYTERITGSHSARGILRSVCADYVQVDLARLYFQQGDRFWIDRISCGDDVVYRKKS